MSFVLVDERNPECGCYSGGEIYEEKIPNVVDSTWNGSVYWFGKETVYARMLCGGLELREVCPEYLKETFQEQTKQFRAFLRACVYSKIHLDKHCVYDLVPVSFLKQYYETKCKIIDHVVREYPKPNDYEFLVDLERVVQEIGRQKLSIEHKKRYIHYNIFGSKTGRLQTFSSSFPILSFARAERSRLKPNNDFFLSFDWNGAEARTFLALSGMQQPEGDIHESNRLLLNMPVETPRDIIKRAIFAHIYRTGNKDDTGWGISTTLEETYKKKQVLEEYWDGEYIHTPFGQTIYADEDHALNYLLQSTCARLLLKKMIEIHDMLKQRESTIAFSMHDSIVLDWAKEDLDLLKPILSVFSSTPWGRFVTNVSAGLDFGEMREFRQ